MPEVAELVVVRDVDEPQWDFFLRDFLLAQDFEKFCHGVRSNLRVSGFSWLIVVLMILLPAATLPCSACRLFPTLGNQALGSDQ
jgi:hypothetical protein